jgi:predicted peptidase
MHADLPASLRRYAFSFAAFLIASCISMTPPPLESIFLKRSMELDGTTHRYQVYIPAEYTRDRAWPVILFLHGLGESGRDGMLQTQVGLGPALRRGQQRPSAIVVFPQCPAGSIWAGAMEPVALAILDKTIAEFRGDRSRLYLTGMSMGAHGVWNIAANHPGLFAAIIPVCGWIQRPETDEHVSAPMRNALRSATPFAAVAEMIRETPAWVFHGVKDGVVPVAQSRQMVEALRRIGADVRYTEYAGVGHDSWVRAYADPELMPWLLSHTRNLSPEAPFNRGE